MSFMLANEAIAAIASRSEKAVSAGHQRNRTSDHHVIENAIREALMQQAQVLITVIPASAVDSAGLLNLRK